MALKKLGAKGLLGYLNNDTKSLAESNKDYQIKMLDCRNIQPNAKNFYGIRNVEELAGEMKLNNGYVEPLSVVEDGVDNYKLISGERRRAAVLLRYEKGEIDVPLVPCIILPKFSANDKYGFSEEEQESLKLVLANAYRTKNTSEIIKEIEILMGLYRKFYEAATKNEARKGSYRSFFCSNIIGMSETKLQGLLSLKKLIPEAMQLIDDGELAMSAGVELAKHIAEEQTDFINKYKAGETGGRISDIRKFFNPEPVQEVPSEESSQSVDIQTDDSTENTSADAAASTEQDDDSSSPAPEYDTGNTETVNNIESGQSDVMPSEEDTDGISEFSEETVKDDNEVSSDNNAVCTISFNLNISAKSMVENTAGSADEFVKNVLQEVEKSTKEAFKEVEKAGDERLINWWQDRLDALRDIINII